MTIHFRLRHREFKQDIVLHVTREELVKQRRIPRLRKLRMPRNTVTLMKKERSLGRPSHWTPVSVIK